MFSALSFFLTFVMSLYLLFFFFFNDTATTEIYTLSLHDALPISNRVLLCRHMPLVGTPAVGERARDAQGDRKSTRLNSSHVRISYAVFCLKKKKTSDVSDELVSVTEKLMDELAHCNNGLTQLDIN